MKISVIMKKILAYTVFVMARPKTWLGIAQ